MSASRDVQRTVLAVVLRISDRFWRRGSTDIGRLWRLFLWKCNTVFESVDSLPPDTVIPVAVEHDFSLTGLFGARDSCGDETLTVPEPSSITMILGKLQEWLGSGTLVAEATSRSR
jgi:hypothetical protein